VTSYRTAMADYQPERKSLDGGGRCDPPRETIPHMTKEDGELFRQLVEVRVALRKANQAKADADAEYNRLITERDVILAQLKGDDR
jgi:hypothetical protein